MHLNLHMGKVFGEGCDGEILGPLLFVFQCIRYRIYLYFLLYLYVFQLCVSGGSG